MQVFELPEKDPLQHAKYLSKDEGLKAIQIYSLVQLQEL
jgi:hypothetical protein